MEPPRGDEPSRVGLMHSNRMRLAPLCLLSLLALLPSNM